MALAPSVPLILSRKKVEMQRLSNRPPPYPTMESKGDDVLSNTSDVPKNDQTPIPTLDQDQKGDGEGKKAEADADGTIELLLVQIQALKAEKRELELRLDDTRKELHRVEADNRSIAVRAHVLEGKLLRTQRDLAASSKDLEAEADRLKRALKDLEADKAKLADANTVLAAEISDLEVLLLAAGEGEEVNVLALRSRAKLMEMRLLGLTEDLRHSKEKEAAVKEKVMFLEAREEELKQAVTALEETKTRLESQLRSQNDRYLQILSDLDPAVEANARCQKLSWMEKAVLSVGALLVVAVTLYVLLRIVG